MFFHECGMIWLCSCLIAITQFMYLFYQRQAWKQILGAGSHLSDVDLYVEDRFTRGLLAVIILAL